MPDIGRRRSIEAQVTASRRQRRETVAAMRAETPRPGAGPPRRPTASRYQRQGERDEEGFAWVVPTTSSNRARPRTLRAGYNAETDELRVEFRDGTPWSYYDVDATTWDRFKRSASPGRFINRVLNSHNHGEGDWVP